jgi:anaerobic glycerol-3-phosphate dehydrogenase
MPLSFDVAVLGGGVTGVSAALAAQLRGARTCLIRGAPGATALASGAWSGPLRPELRDALAAAGLELSRTRGALLHERGQRVIAEFAASTHVDATADTQALVCGFAGLPHFNAPTLARLWNREQPLASRTILLDATPTAGWSTASLAAHLERSVDSLLPHLNHMSLPRVIFPAVLGIARSAEVVARLAAHGVQAAEALAAAPSLPGWRMQAALERVLDAHGIITFGGRAQFERGSGRRVESVRVGDEVIAARAFVLATGKFVAGGLTADEEFREPVFELPIWLEQLGDVFTSPDALSLTDPVRTEHQPLLHAGVHTDDAQQPVGRAGEVIYQNVFAAGTVRASWPVAATPLGACAEDGWRAGVSASA